jgi:hypothetical protein
MADDVLLLFQSRIFSWILPSRHDRGQQCVGFIHVKSRGDEEYLRVLPSLSADVLR